MTELALRWPSVRHLDEVSKGLVQLTVEYSSSTRSMPCIGLFCSRSRFMPRALMDRTTSSSKLIVTAFKKRLGGPARRGARIRNVGAPADRSAPGNLIARRPDLETGKAKKNHRVTPCDCREMKRHVGSRPQAVCW